MSSETDMILREDLTKLNCGPVCNEFRFDETRKWRFDWALPLVRVAIEVDGGAWSGGRHTRGQGFIKDLEKINAATAQGWKVYRFTPQQVGDGSAVEFLRKAIQ